MISFCLGVNVCGVHRIFTKLTQGSAICGGKVQACPLPSELFRVIFSREI